MAVYVPLRSVDRWSRDTRGRDNAHEDTKGHERHVAPDSNPESIEFPGIEELYERFWDEIPKQRFGPSGDVGDIHE